jgi:hypothetical protein
MEIKKKMANKPQKLLAILLILFVSSVYAVIVTQAHAEVTTTTSTEKGLTILNQVAGFDLSKYNATPTLNVNGPTLGTLPTENIRYTLENDKSRIDILETFTNGNLKMIDVLEKTGSFYMATSPAAVVRMAKAFLSNYQSYSANSFYGKLSSMLNKADATKNSTTIVGNIKFDITTTSGNSAMGNSTTFTWSYTSNGITATVKCVSLEYRDGFLKAFIDTWNLYKIGSTTVNLSEKQAAAIAMKNARTYTWSIGSDNQTIVINNFNVTKPMVTQLMFCEAGNANNARDSDQLVLYPMWRIGVGLDKYYPGNVYGISVDIWADTGQVKDIYELFSTLPASTGETATIAESSISNQTSAATVQKDSFPVIWIGLAPFAVITIGVFPIWLIKKKIPLRLPKMHKIGEKVFCILLVSMMFISLASAVPTANAACSVVWGNTSAGDPYLYHTASEISLQKDLSWAIDTLFGYAGYAHHNYEANDQTTKSNVLYYTGYYGQCYPSVETVYFDHGVGMTNVIGYPYQNEWHYMLCTDLSESGNPDQNVFDYQLYSATSDNNHFSYISTCHSGSLYNGDYFGGTGTYGANQGGSGNIIGMPYAWTHGASMSTNGFTYPDTGPYCYIGFVGGSAALDQVIPYPSGNTKYCVFVLHFFIGLLNNDLTVNQALDYASYQAFYPAAFAGTALYQGFTAYWEGLGQDSGKMVVYGNGDIYLYPGGPDYVTTPSVSGPTSGYTNTAYQFSASATDPYDYQLWYTFNWGDGSDPTVTNYPIDVSHTWTSAGPYTITVTAQSQNGVSSSPSYYDVNIANPDPVYHYLTVEAYSEWYCPLHPAVYVDSNYVGTAPVTISVLEGWHDVQVDYCTWNELFGCDTYFDYLSYDDGYTGYGWGSPVPVYHDQYATAWYYP